MIKCIPAYEDPAANLKLCWLIFLLAVCLVSYGCRHRSSHESGYKAFHCSAHWKGSDRQPRTEYKAQCIMYRHQEKWHERLCHSKMHSGIFSLKILLIYFGLSIMKLQKTWKCKRTIHCVLFENIHRMLMPKRWDAHTHTHTHKHTMWITALKQHKLTLKLLSTV